MGAAAAIIIRKEKEIVRAFRNARATSAAKSVSTSEIGVAEHVPFRILRRRDILRETAPGRYYLDEVSWERSRIRRRRTVTVLLVLVLVLGAVAMYKSMHGG